MIDIDFEALRNELKKPGWKVPENQAVMLNIVDQWEWRKKKADFQRRKKLNPEQA